MAKADLLACHCCGTDTSLICHECKQPACAYHAKYATIHDVSSGHEQQVVMCKWCVESLAWERV